MVWLIWSLNSVFSGRYASRMFFFHQLARIFSFDLESCYRPSISRVIFWLLFQTRGNDGNETLWFIILLHTSIRFKTTEVRVFGLLIINLLTLDQIRSAIGKSWIRWLMLFLLFFLFWQLTDWPLCWFLELVYDIFFCLIKTSTVCVILDNFRFCDRLFS